MGRSTTANSLEEADIVVGKLSHILVLHEYWTLGLYQRFLIWSFRGVVSFEVISHREVHLKPLIAALERLFKRGA